MHRVDSFIYISFFVLCILYILDLLGELFLEHAPRATHVAPAGDQGHRVGYPISREFEQLIMAATEVLPGHFTPLGRFLLN